LLGAPVVLTWRSAVSEAGGDGMKLGIVGKGGVGKTTVSALLAAAYSRQGRRVIAVDTDSNPNLGLSLGLGLQQIESLPVLPRKLVMGEAGQPGADEVIRDYGRVTPSGPKLLAALDVPSAGGGCNCGGHASVRNLLEQALDAEADVTLVDMEAGLEHLSRSGGTLAYADILLAVMEPTRKSVLTAVRTRAIAEELGIPLVFGLGNKVRSGDERAFLSDAAAQQQLPLAGLLPYDERVAEADRSGDGAVTPGPDLAAALGALVEFVDEAAGRERAPA
jgi:CO dehydrogenase maturation factor